MINPTDVFKNLIEVSREKFTADFFNLTQGIDWGSWFYIFKSVMFYLTIIFAILFVVVIYKIRQLQKGSILQQVAELEATMNPPAEAVSAYDNRWSEIKKHVNSFNEAEWKMAVIEGDKFVDDALKSGGYLGESMGERLMMIQPGQLLSLQQLWDAHKLRNLLVHDVNYQLTHRQAVLAIEAFESVLRELGALS